MFCFSGSFVILVPPLSESPVKAPRTLPPSLWLIFSSFMAALDP